MISDKRTSLKDLTTSRLSRRRLVAAAAAATVVSPLTESAMAQDAPENDTEFPPYGTPAATPTISVSLKEFRTLCQRLGGIDDEAEVGDETLEQLRNLLLQNEQADGDAYAAGLQELLAAGNDTDRTTLSYAANSTATAILSFLFLGEFDGASLDNRSELYPNLVSYQLLPYATTPAICKGADYWTAEVDLPPRS